MRLGDKDYSVAFLLGAGASRGAIKHVLHRAKRLKPPINGDFFNVAKAYARAEGSNSVAQRRVNYLLETLTQEFPRPMGPTMEQAFSLLYVIKDFPEIYGNSRGRKPKAGNAKGIDSFLRLLFPILTMLDRSNTRQTGYDRLVQCLSDDDTLITLNYDTMLDSALHRLGWDPSRGYGITGSQSKFSWKAVQRSDGKSALKSKLIKLHGSTNWFVRGTTSNLKRVFSNKPVKITQPRENEIANHIRQIVPPIFGKIFEHDHWRVQWQNAYTALCEAEVLVVIGSSLIDTDFHLRALFTQVVRTRNDKFRFVVLVDRAVVRRKWLSVLRGSYVKSIQHKSFEKFLHSELKV